MYAKVYVEITNICNMRCSFCHGHSRAPRQMNREEFGQILQQLEGKTNFIYYHLMGEPLTHPLLPEFLEMAKERGFRSVITTNGKLLGKLGGRLIGAGVHKVSISLHSFEEDHDDAFDKYIRQAAVFAGKAAEEGTIVVLRLWNKGFDGGRNTLAEKLLRELLDGPWVPNTRGVRIRDRLFLEWGDRFQWPDAQAPVQGEEFNCYGLKDHFGILCDGSVVPCCMDSDGCITLGNIFRQELGEILDSSRARDMVLGFKRREAAEELCRRCGYARRFV